MNFFYVSLSLVMSTFRTCQKRVMLKGDKSDLLPPKVRSASILRAAITIASQGRGVRNCSDDSSVMVVCERRRIVMADQAKEKATGNYSMASGPNMAKENLVLQWATKVLRHLVVKFEF